ncbi:hypothetical protein [Pseudomonas sp. TWI628]|uniref:hypothetical protein n=1 Tax=Pseudomonas sp. TWI628 TaxID=3136788 RepID=UPI0032079771
MKNTTAHLKNSEFLKNGAKASGTYEIKGQQKKEFNATKGALYLLGPDDPKQQVLYFGVTFTVKDDAKKSEQSLSLAFKMPRLIPVDVEYEFPEGPIDIKALLIHPSAEADKAEQEAVKGKLKCVARDDNGVIATAQCAFESSQWIAAISFQVDTLTVSR